MFSFSRGQQAKRQGNVDGPEQGGPLTPRRRAPTSPDAEVRPGRRRTLILGQPPERGFEQPADPITPPLETLEERPVGKPDVGSPTDLHEPESVPETTSPADVAAAGLEPSLEEEIHVEGGEHLELENFRDADIYESIDDIDDFDAFEEAQQLKAGGLAQNDRPQSQRAVSLIDRIERLPSPVEQAQQISPYSGEQDASQPQDVTLATDTRPSALARSSERPNARSHPDEDEAGDVTPRDEAIIAQTAVQSRLQTTDDRRPQIGAVHGAKLSSLLRIPTGDEAAISGDADMPRGDALPATETSPKASAPTAMAPSVAMSQPDMELQPASPRKRRRQPAVNTGFLPTLLIAEVPRLRRFAAAMIGDEGAADHLVQDTLQQAIAEPDELRSDRELCVSLLMILYRLRSEVLKQLKKAPQPSMTRSFSDLLFQRLQGADLDEVKEFADAIGKLGEEDRALLLLIALESLDYRDIATVVKVPAGRVMAKVAHAREQLSLALGASVAEADQRLNAGGQG